jgi:hypothetical protein
MLPLFVYRALLATIEPSQASQAPEFKELQLGSGPMLLKTLDFMNEFLDDTVAEQQKVIQPLNQADQPPPFPLSDIPY